MEKIIIAAVAKDNVIGKNGIMPWHSKEDLAHFKKTTMSYPVIMGRKTLESMGKPLKGRLNIILTHDPGYTVKSENTDVLVINNLNEAYEHCKKKGFEKVFILGGGEVYKQEINNVDKLYISHMKLKAEGDTFFPEINNDIWKIEREEEFNDFVLKVYTRK